MMPRPRPPHLHRETNRHGNTVWYVRLGKGPRIRIEGVYGTPDFEAAYRAVINGELPIPSKKAAKGTLEWLWLLYRQTDAWIVAIESGLKTPAIASCPPTRSVERCTGNSAVTTPTGWWQAASS